MSLGIKFFMVVMIFGIAGLFVLKKPDGTPWLSVSDFTPDTRAISDSAKSMTKTVTNTIKETAALPSSEAPSGGVYRWKDANGQWRYSDKAPDNVSENQQVETLQVSGDLNRDLVEEGSRRTPESSNQGSNNTADTSISPTSISPEKISKLIDDTKNVKKMMEERNSRLEQLQ